MNYLYTLLGIIIGIGLSQIAPRTRKLVDEVLDKIEKRIQDETRGKAAFIDPFTKEMQWKEAEEIDDLII